MTNKEECTMCDGQGYMTNDNYETGDCIACDGTGFVLVEKNEELLEMLHERDAQIADLHRQLLEKDAGIKACKEALEEISDFPKVRGIGGFMDKYNEIIAIAEHALKRLN